MSDNSNNPVSVPRTARQGPSLRLRKAITTMLSNHGHIEQHGEKPWASITFAGTRHSLRLRFEGRIAVEAAETFVAILPEHEFTLPGQLVADATIITVESSWLPEPSTVIECEILVLDDA